MTDENKQLVELSPIEGEYLGREPKSEEIADFFLHAAIANSMLKALYTAPPEPPSKWEKFKD